MEKIIKVILNTKSAIAFFTIIAIGTLIFFQCDGEPKVKNLLEIERLEERKNQDINRAIEEEAEEFFK